MIDFRLDNNCLVNLDPGASDKARNHDSAAALRELVKQAPEHVWFSWESSSERGPGGAEPERFPARFRERLQRIGIAESQGVLSASVVGHMRLDYSRLPMENESVLSRSMAQVLLGHALVDERKRSRRCDVWESGHEPCPDSRRAERLEVRTRLRGRAVRRAYGAASGLVVVGVAAHAEGV